MHILINIHAYIHINNLQTLYLCTHTTWAKGAWCRIGWTAHRKTDPSGFDAVTSYFEKSSARLDSTGVGFSITTIAVSDL